MKGRQLADTEDALEILRAQDGKFGLDLRHPVEILESYVKTLRYDIDMGTDLIRAHPMRPGGKDRGHLERTPAETR